MIAISKIKFRFVQIRSYFHRGFTLIEILLTLAVIGILFQIAIPAYMDYIERVRVAEAVSDIAVMSILIKNYEMNRDKYPESLTDIGSAGKLDPWKRPYVYLNLTTNESKGASRRDRNLNPLNSDFDLYSVGKNGITKKQISNNESLDDVIRANDGAFINLAAKYTR